MKIYNDWTDLVADPEWSQYLSDNHISLEAVQAIWKEAQNSLLLTKSHKEKTVETFTDSRDGKIYKTVKIGNKIWMAENLAYDNVDHYYPNDNEADAEKYGYLYTWENAMRACPEGWRLPTKDEFLKLINTRGYLDLANPAAFLDESWRNDSSDNNTGFSAIPAGGRIFNLEVDEQSPIYYRFGVDAYFWSSTSCSCDTKTSYYLGVDPISAKLCNHHKYSALSIRCVKEIE